ncbi:MAG TPA: hypothetical protein VGN17_12255 [Bryobacteraceae bacterium]|jgi:hypothetical protein
MDVLGHLVSKNGRAEVRMPRCKAGVDSLGIRWEGEVLQGSVDVEVALRRDRGGEVAGGEKLRNGWRVVAGLR